MSVVPAPNSFDVKDRIMTFLCYLTSSPSCYSLFRWLMCEEETLNALLYQGLQKCFFQLTWKVSEESVEGLEVSVFRGLEQPLHFSNWCSHSLSAWISVQRLTQSHCSREFSDSLNDEISSLLIELWWRNSLMRYLLFTSVYVSNQTVDSIQGYHNAATTLNGLHWSLTPIAKKCLQIPIKVEGCLSKRVLGG